MENTKIIEGWVIKYNLPSVSVDLGTGRSVTEVIAAGAFTESVNAINAGTAQAEVNIEHEDDAVNRIGLTGSNVKIENRPEGVYATVSMLSDSLSADMFAKIQAGIVRGLSPEFRKIAGYDPVYTTDPSGNYVRTWTKATLTGFAICVAPCYPDAKIVKANDVMFRTIKAMEMFCIKLDISTLELKELSRRYRELQDRYYRSKR